MRILVSLAFAAMVAATAPVAFAEEKGTMGLAPKGEWAASLSDDEMADLRGGFFGLRFSFFFELLIDKVGGEPVTTVDATVTTSPTSAEIKVNTTDVAVTSIVGGFNNFSGVFNNIDIKGNGNIVIMNVTFNFTLVNGNQLPPLSFTLVPP